MGAEQRKTLELHNLLSVDKKRKIPETNLLQTPCAAIRQTELSRKKTNRATEYQTSQAVSTPLLPARRLVLLLGPCSVVALKVPELPGKLGSVKGEETGLYYVSPLKWAGTSATSNAQIFHTASKDVSENDGMAPSSRLAKDGCQRSRPKTQRLERRMQSTSAGALPCREKEK